MPEQPILLVSIRKPGDMDWIKFSLGCEDMLVQAEVIRKCLGLPWRGNDGPAQKAQLQSVRDLLIDLADYGLGNINMETAAFALLGKTTRAGD